MKIFKSLTERIVGGLIVAAIAGTVGWFVTNWDNNPNETKIIVPEDGATVSHMVSAEGVYSEELTKVDLWLVVQPVNAPTYHPQTSTIPRQTNRQWTGVAYIGESEKKNIGEEFIVHLVSASPQASKNFREYLSKSEKDKKWQGMPELPSGSTIQDNIKVFRK